ncbi:hypothetical protein ACFL01_04400, partial [Planctomycetota bacterium]
SDRWSIFGSIEYKGLEDEIGEIAVTFRRQLHKWTMDITLMKDDEENEELFWISFYPEGFDRSLFGFRQTVKVYDED